MGRKITAEVYDNNVIAEGVQFQVDTYYQPQSTAQQRRIAFVLGELNPQPQDIILDIGCGVGTFAYHCAKKGARTYGIDYSRQSIKVAAELAERFATAERSSFVVGSALSLPFAEAFFDKIVCVDFIEHITHAEKDVLLKEIYRVLKPNGKGIIFTPNALREDIGVWYWKLRHYLFKERIPKTDLHYGLIGRKSFESMLRGRGFNFRFRYADTTRPFLAGAPVFRHALALNLMWMVEKR
ncbi:MAG: class I SAM-dependent methyltransferase [Candidatus Omnitrophica bacterium]|nr:class I SAM-dependent methyltransferase [Candidatus Omnitrophota bacterium]MBU4477816.1 class I SAM-dependent methyltransferase [Candidatus Omnitrophota bacterium]MCG2703548.1 class I SAM-dependent methyltransferase [Candidatus Omnitrophota bacterium]